MNDLTVKHLDMIQNVISRMAQNSFMLKGWSVVVVAALFALAASEADGRLGMLAFFPALMFWGLDAYYVRQERLFRRLYDAVRSADTPSDFSMDTSPYESQVNRWRRVMFSKTVGWFHGVILIAILVVVGAQ